ncbi:MAG TPA: hypothetical protein VLA52_12870 [Thermohalobaculum sp.]|nr:hypothetical protein [Thermohalobaculum sp.]
MSLLREIQASLMQEGSDLGPTLLKLRYLASRLGSDPLESWVKHEAEGYPNDVEVPEYRKLGVSYQGNFSGPFGSGIRNAPIPAALIEKFAGQHWVKYEMRQSVAAVDDLIAVGKGEGGTLQINASNLILLLQGNVYEDYACNSVVGSISKASLVELQYAVRTRMLELTIQIEKSIPGSADLKLGPPEHRPTINDANKVSQITNQVIYGNYTNVTSTGDTAQITISIATGDRKALFDALVKGGIPDDDAAELVDIAATEGPENENEPFGTRAKGWLAKGMGKVADGTWKIGVSAATSLITEALLRYHGLK